MSMQNVHFPDHLYKFIYGEDNNNDSDNSDPNNNKNNNINNYNRIDQFTILLKEKAATKSIRELKTYLREEMNVDTSGCLQKTDLIEKLIQSLEFKNSSYDSNNNPDVVGNNTRTIFSGGYGVINRADIYEPIRTLKEINLPFSFMMARNTEDNRRKYVFYIKKFMCTYYLNHT